MRALGAMAIVVGVILLVQRLMQPPWGVEMIVPAALVIVGGYFFLRSS